MLFDTLAGIGIMYYLTNGNWLASLIISLATSGLLILLMVLFYSNQESPVLFVVTAVIFLLDVAFDSLSADVMRFGAYSNLSGVSDAGLHWMFRILIGGLSTVGDAVAMAIVVGMPVIKNILHDALPKKRPAPQKIAPPPGARPPAFTTQPQKYVPQNKPPVGGRPPQYPPQPKHEPTYQNLFRKDERD
jgi:hypothetical protein